jgi:hypothetical protein
MRVPIGCFVLMAACFSAAQTSQEFHSKYGEPDVERFTARPGIGLTVEFASDGLACHRLLEPLQPLLQREEHFMSSDAVTDVLEEITPAGIRGKETHKITTMSGCNKIEIVEYENLSIARSTNSCIPSSPNRDTKTTVTLKREACRTQHQ